MSSAQTIRAALAQVVDPEIPSCSIADLGMIERVEVSADAVDVELLPTFVGCPAKYVIRERAQEAVARAAPGLAVRVRFVYDPPWTADRVSPRGREALRDYGISSTRTGSGETDLACPYCGSAETVLESPFGPTPCRTTHFCRACRNVFEGFKDKGRPQADARKRLPIGSGG